MHRLSSNLVRLVLGASFVSIVAGCKFDPTQNAHSQAQPESVHQDGVWWIAFKMGGDNDQWYWLPEPVAAVKNDIKWQKETPVDVLVNGKVWRLTKENDKISASAPFDPPDLGPSPESVGGWIVVLVVGLGCLTFGVYSRCQLEDERDKTKAAGTEIDALTNSMDEFKRERAALVRRQKGLEEESRRKQQELQQQTELAIAQSVQAVRDAADERYRTALAANNLEELDQRLREAQLIFSRSGRVLTVRVFATPTGWVGIEWMLEPSLPYPLRVVGKKDGKVMFAEYAYKGMFGDVLPRGKEHTFVLHALDGEADRDPGFQFVVKVPTEKQWQRQVNGLRLTSKPPPVDDGAERERRIIRTIHTFATEEELWEKARREGHERIDAAGGSDIEKRQRKATFDTKLIEEREKEAGKKQ